MNGLILVAWTATPICTVCAGTGLVQWQWTGSPEVLVVDCPHCRRVLPEQPVEAVTA